MQSGSPFAGFTRIGDKKGGANSGGEFGGWYEDKNHRQILFKKDEDCTKVMGEYLAGCLLQAMYQALEVSPAYYATVELRKPITEDAKGKRDTYLGSWKIPEYAADLWAYAWDKIKKEKRPEKRPEVVPGRKHKWVDQFLLESNLLEEFATLVVPRLLIADFGVHDGNFGIVLDFLANPHVVSLDYGAGLFHLSTDFDPFSMIREISNFYKNHFREYSKKKITTSPQMANAFIQVGSMIFKTIEMALEQGMQEITKHYDAHDLLRFCKRLGMNRTDLKKQTDIQLISKEIRIFIKEKIQQRQLFLKIRGNKLLAEHPANSVLEAPRPIEQFHQDGNIFLRNLPIMIATPILFALIGGILAGVLTSTLVLAPIGLLLGAIIGFGAAALGSSIKEECFDANTSSTANIFCCVSASQLPKEKETDAAAPLIRSAASTQPSFLDYRRAPKSDGKHTDHSEKPNFVSTLFDKIKRKF